MKVDIVIPCASYHRDAFLRSVPMWEKVSKSESVGRILVVCHGWYPEEKDLGVVDALVDVRSEGWCPSIARNTGLYELDSDLVLYCDADVVLPPEVVEAHVSAHREEGPPLLTANLHKDISVSGELPLTADGLDKLMVPDVWRSMRVDWRVSVLDECDWLRCEPSVPIWSLGGGSGICAPRRWVAAVGGWNESFVGWGYEDAEFWYRCQKSGFDFRFLNCYAYHQQHEVDIGLRLSDSRDNAETFLRERDNCKVTYVAEVVTEELAQIVLSSDYNAEALGPFPLDISSPFGIRSAPISAQAPIEDFRKYARGWYLCDLREGELEPSFSDWGSLVHCGSHTVRLGGLDYVPRSSTGFVQHRISGGVHNAETSGGPY